MKEFTHINALYQVARWIKKRNKVEGLEPIKGPISFKGTVKLHGCNVGIACSDELVAQSRSRTLEVDNDHYGFAHFVSLHQYKFQLIASQIRAYFLKAVPETITLFGEWIGPGIQKGVAINKLPDKQLVIYAAYVASSDPEARGLYLDNLSFKSIPEARIFNINDAMSYGLTVDFGHRQSLENAAEKASIFTAAVESLCPWAALFDITGTGEGIVWKPLGKYVGWSDLYFKTKGEKHKGRPREAKIKIAITPEVLNNINEFIAFACTPGRLEQGLEVIKEQGLSFEMKSLGSYLKWVGNDIMRECADELESNKLEWKQVAKEVTKTARKYFQKALQDG